MDVSGWIIQTERAGRQQYWKVGEIDPDQAAEIAREAAGADTAKKISRIAARPASQFTVAPGTATELWESRPNARISERPNAATAFEEIQTKRSGEISFDIVVPDAGVPIVEGCYRIDGEDWKVYLLVSERNKVWTVGSPRIENDAVLKVGSPVSTELFRRIACSTTRPS